MAHRHGHSVGGIGARGQFGDGKNAQQHRRHLFLAGVPVAGDALFHAFWGVFHHRKIALQCCCDGNTLRTAQLQHALHVLAEELRLDRQFVRMMSCDDARGLAEYRAQLQRMVIAHCKANGTGVEEAHLACFHDQHAVAHHRGTGIYAEYDTLRGCGHRSTFDRLPFNADEGTVSRRTILFIRWGVFVLACAFLYLRLAKHGDLVGFAEVFRGRDPDMLFGALGVVLLLMVLNWGLESMKWRMLVRGIEPVSFAEAFKATIAGTSIGMITPNRVGEFVGRVLFLAPENRIPASFATAVGSIAQFVITLLLGTVGLIALILTAQADGVGPQSVAWIALCAVVAVCTLLLYFTPDLLRAVVARLPIVRKWERHAAVLEGFRTRLLLIVLLFSALRYVVFTVQFTIILHVLAGVGINDSLMAIPVAFLFSTLIPTVMLTELGVRGSVAVALISPQVTYDKGVFLASTTLWLVNIALPALSGSIILLVARIRSTSKA